MTFSDMPSNPSNVLWALSNDLEIADFLCKVGGLIFLY